MPVITVQLIEGRSPEALERLGTILTDAMTSWGVPRESTTVLIHEVPRANWLAGGKRVGEV